MENASRAMIIAGEVLIGMLVVGIFVFLFVTFGQFSANMNNQISTDQVQRYNYNFYKFDGRVNITADEIAGLINLARQNNYDRDIKQNEYDNEFYTHINIDGVNSDFLRNLSSNEYKNVNLFKKALNKFIAEHNMQYYSCNVSNYKIENPTTKNSKYNITDITLKDEDYFYKNLNSLGFIYNIRFDKTIKKTTPDYYRYEFNVANKDLFTIKIEGK